MSRKIDLTKPLSSDDAEYLRQRGGLPENAVLEDDSSGEADDTEESDNSEEFEDTESEEEESPGEFSGMTLEELKAIARAKNISVGGSKAELVERLEQS